MPDGPETRAGSPRLSASETVRGLDTAHSPSRRRNRRRRPVRYVRVPSPCCLIGRELSKCAGYIPAPYFADSLVHRERVRVEEAEAATSRRGFLWKSTASPISTSR